MKVLCIKDDWETNLGPSVGDVDIVEYCDTSKGLHYYALFRFPKHLHLQEHFIPLSDIDETEMIRESLKTTV